MPKSSFSEGFLKPKKDAGGIKRAGDIPAVAQSLAGTTLKLKPPVGVYDGVSADVVLLNALAILGLKRFATGSFNVSAATIEFFNGNNTTQQAFYINVAQAFGFTPTTIIVYSSGGGYTIYNANSDYRGNLSMTSRILCCSINTSIWTPYQLTANAYVNSSGFQLPHNRQETITWIAIE